MKKIFLILIVVTSIVNAQSPEKMSYQAIVRNSSDVILTDTPIGMQISILQGSTSGASVYVETQNPTTNTNGLVNIEIGVGVVVSGDFSVIDWADGPYFIKTETAVEEPLTSYTITGVSQLLSVPYALHAKTAEILTGTITEMDPNVPTGTQTGQMQYWDGSEWVTVDAGNEGQVLTFVGGVPKWTTQIEDGDVKNPVTGKIWMDRNLGASQVATSSTDVDAYGDLYQWGRDIDGHQSRTSTTTTELSDSDTPGHSYFIINDYGDWRNPQNENLWQGVNGINNPCPTGYRLPTSAEWYDEYKSWSSQNAAGAFSSPLKLPLSGYRSYINGDIKEIAVYGNYWSSTYSYGVSRYLYFGSTKASTYTIATGNGLSVRCIKE